MLRLRVPRRHPRYADIMATLAFVVATSGAAYAVAAVPPNSVGTAQLKDGAVTNPKVAADAITTTKVKDGAVKTTDIAAANVTGSLLADGSVTSLKVGDGAITGPKLAQNSVSNSKVIDGAITSTKVSDGAITSTKVADGAITSTRVADGAITSTKIGASSIDSSKVASNSLNLSDLVGTDRTGAISFSLGANACGTLNFGVSGAQVGEAGLLTLTGSTSPGNLMLGPLRVTAAGQLSARACNISSSSLSVSNLGVRVITFG
jgi:hypothetical protein